VINLALWVAGLALVGLAIWRVRGPFARMGELDHLAENARRYDSWRGGRRATAAGEETTGADVMRALLRRQVTLWTAVGLAGIVLIVAGFAIR
jgi:hypothetical protein